MPNFNVFGPFHFNDFTENGILRNDAQNKYPSDNSSISLQDLYLIH